MTTPGDESIVTAWAEPAAGPGWANTPVWVLIRQDGTCNYRVTCLQPDEQTPAMRTLYQVSAATHAAMRAEAIVAILVATTVKTS